MPKAATESEMVGWKLGFLTVIAYGGQGPGGSRWICQCECGIVCKVVIGKLKSGHTKFCGCYRKKVTAIRSTIHGLSKTPAHVRWMGMIARCTRPDQRNFKYYGARGITVCERWMKFSNFIKDMGLPPRGLVLDRINNNGNYEPANCHWVTQKENANNRRPKTKKL